MTSKPYTFTRSRELHERAMHSIPGGVSSGIRKLEMPVPLYFEHGRGSRLWDVDGNEYIDFQIGQGALLFGHAPEGLRVTEATFTRTYCLTNKTLIEKPFQHLFFYWQLGCYGWLVEFTF